MPTPSPTILEVAIAWSEDAFLRVEHRPLDRAFVLGAGESDFELEDAQLGRPSLRLVVPTESGPTVTVPRGATISVATEGSDSTTLGPSDVDASYPLGDGETVTIAFAGFRFRIRQTLAEAETRRDVRPIALGFATVAAAFALVAGVAVSSRPDESLRIVAETTIDLSHPLVAALVAERRANPEPVYHPRVVAMPRPTFAPQHAPVAVAPEAIPAPAPASAPAPAPASASASVSASASDSASDSDSDSDSASAPESAVVDFGGEDLAASTPPRELGAIRSHVRALSRCFEERRAATELGTAEARARLDACLAEASNVPPDAIVSYAIEVRSGDGRIERASGGAFGVAAPR